MTNPNRKHAGINEAATDRYVDLHGKDQNREPEQALFPKLSATVAAVDQLRAKCWCERKWLMIPRRSPSRAAPSLAACPDATDRTVTPPSGKPPSETRTRPRHPKPCQGVSELSPDQGVR